MEVGFVDVDKKKRVLIADLIIDVKICSKSGFIGEIIYK